MVRIRFLSETDETNGFYLLATEASVRGLRDGVYEVTQARLTLLDKHAIRYEVLGSEVVLLNPSLVVLSLAKDLRSGSLRAKSAKNSGVCRFM